jgi:hypothetical protein
LFSAKVAKKAVRSCRYRELAINARRKWKERKEGERNENRKEENEKEK